MSFVVGLEACRQYLVRWKPETTLGRLPRFKNISTANSIPNPTKRTREQVVLLGELQKKAKKTQDRVDEILGAESDEDKRINKLVDAFVEQLVKNPPERAIPAM